DRSRRISRSPYEKLTLRNSTKGGARDMQKAGCGPKEWMAAIVAAARKAGVCDGKPAGATVCLATQPCRECYFYNSDKRLLGKRWRPFLLIFFRPPQPRPSGEPHAHGLAQPSPGSVAPNGDGVRRPCRNIPEPARRHPECASASARQ